MALEKRFLHPKINILELPRSRFFGGIIIGIIYSFVWYALMSLSRELVRITFSTINNDIADCRIWTFTDSEVNFYNIFFAFIAVILGHSECIRFWLERQRKFHDRYFRRKVSIINDQRALNWTFLLTFSKLFGLVALVISGFMWRYEAIDIKTEYSSVFILMIIVLYLNTWNGIRHLFKNASLKWMLLSMVIVVISALLLSRINLIDYQSINNTACNNCISCKEEIEVPDLGVSTLILTSKSFIRTFHIAIDTNSKPIYYFEGDSIGLKDIDLAIKKHNQNVDLKLRERIISLCIIDKRIKMKYINEFHKELLKSPGRKIAYEIIPNKELSLNNRGMNSYFGYRISDYPYDWYLEYKTEEKDSVNYIEIHPDGTDKYLINNINYEKEDLIPYFSEIITKENYSFEFHIDDEMTFNHYLQLLMQYDIALKKIKNEYSLNMYNEPYKDYMDFKIKRIIDSKYYHDIYEIRSNMLE